MVISHSEAVFPATEISLKYAEGTGAAGTTNSSGKFKVLGLAPGVYEISARRVGFEDKQQSVTVIRDEVTEARLTLQGGPSSPLSEEGGSTMPASIDQQRVDSSADEKAKHDLLNLENHWLQVEEDPAALDSILAPDFLHVVPVGIITRNEQLDFMRKHPSRGHSAKKHFEDMHVRVYGIVGIVNGIVVATEGEATQRTLFTDVFAYRDGRWQAVSAQELPAAEKPQ